MKKIFLTLCAFCLFLVGCTKTESKVIKVASHTSPMLDILELVKEDIAKEGYTLEVVKVSDNVQANVALNNKEVDANFFQHKMFMEMFNKGNKGNLTVLQPIYDAIVSYYSSKYQSIDALPTNAKVAIPSDPSNLSRALRLLAQHNVITLKDPTSYTQTLETIKENPKNLEFKLVGLLTLNDAYKEHDLIFNYPTYIAKLGLTPSANGLIFEKGDDSTFAISVVAREDNLESAKIKALKKVMASEKVKKFVEEKLKGHAKVAF